MSSLGHTDCVGRNLHQMIIMYIECTSLKEQLSSKTAVAFRLDDKGHRGPFHSGLERQLFLRLDSHIRLQNVGMFKPCFMQISGPQCWAGTRVSSHPKACRNDPETTLPLTAAAVGFLACPSPRRSDMPDRQKSKTVRPLNQE